MGSSEQYTLEMGKDNPTFELDPSDSNIQAISPELESKERHDEDSMFEDLEPLSGISFKIEHIHNHLLSACRSSGDPASKKKRMYSIGVLVALILNAFFIWSISHYWTLRDEKDIDWCNGVGLFILIVLAIYLTLGYYIFVQRFILNHPFVHKVCHQITDRYSSMSWLPKILYASFTVGLLIFVIIDTWEDQQRLIPFFGIFVLVFLGFITSKHPGRIVWRQIFWGLGIQFAFGLIILRWEVGRNTFACMGQKVKHFLDFTDQGSEFVYGYLVSGKPIDTSKIKNQTLLNDMNAINDKFGTVLYFKVLSVIYFFSFIVSMLFYAGIMQKIVSKIGWLLQITMGTTACESMNAAANIFLGQSEAPLIIKPYLPLMTSSEIHAIMTGGFATIAGTVLAAFIHFGVPPEHLLSASVMSAPAALASAKLLYPESKKSKTVARALGSNFNVKGDGTNFLDAATQGAIAAAQLVINIGACLIAFLAFIGFLNAILAWCGNLVGYPGISFEYLLGKMFIPLAWILGCDYKDLDEIGKLIGLKSFITEFVAFQQLGLSKTLSKRSRIIGTYALCGFANPASMGIQIASLSTMAPNRRGAITSVAIRAYFAGSLACFLTACVAGTLVVV